MIDLLQLEAPEAERIAYAEGFTGVGELLARLSDAEATISQLLDMIDDADGKDWNYGDGSLIAKLREVIA